MLRLWDSLQYCISTGAGRAVMAVRAVAVVPGRRSTVVPYSVRDGWCGIRVALFYSVI